MSDITMNDQSRIEISFVGGVTQRSNKNSRKDLHVMLVVQSKMQIRPSKRKVNYSKLCSFCNASSQYDISPVYRLIYGLIVARTTQPFILLGEKCEFSWTYENEASFFTALRVSLLCKSTICKQLESHRVDRYI